MPNPEILAPAGNREALQAAVYCGADAVYVGATAYSARQGAENFDLPALAEASRLCRLYGVKLYLAVNTLLTDRELPEFQAFMQQAARFADGCIVQDLGVLKLLRELLPDMPLHASTQMSIHTPAGALEAAALGCYRVVAAREMAEPELAALCRLPVEVEVFVHGALCMSVSGQCAFSALVGGRSANRGACAQACRLPWKTPVGRNPAALSLKDESLIDHVGKLREMGVASLKIEGRMKRPEYVAAAVTALKQALAGEQPDRELLQAVFSRSGFTDGYFTGKKRDMFGFRRKEDVLAGQQVIGGLAGLYREMPKAAVLHFSLSLKPDVPAVLTASDGADYTVTVQGDVPETARKSPLSEEQLTRSLQKLGGTVYTCGTMKLDNPAGLMLSAAQCNALRREAVSRMDELRIARHTPECRIRTVAFPAAFRELQPTRRRIHVRTELQLQAVPEGEITCIPLSLAETASGVSKWLEAPRIIGDEAAYKKQLKALRERGFTELVCHNLADVRIGRELGFGLHGGFGLNVTNSLTVASLRENGLQDVTGSYELRMHTLERIGKVFPVGAVVYGRLPMMLFRVCPIRAQDGCRNGNCFLTDRTGRKFPLLCSGTYQELVNAEVLWVADKGYQPDFADYYFTDETPERVQEVLHGGNPPANRTGGLYEKGGLR